jgi:hypothetical protein
MTHNTTPTKTYYLSKYALSSKGVITTFETEDTPGKYVFVAGTWQSFKVGRDAHETPEAAIAAAEAARAKKIASLKKQIAALEKLTFTVEESK